MYVLDVKAYNAHIFEHWYIVSEALTKLFMNEDYIIYDEGDTIDNKKIDNDVGKEISLLIEKVKDKQLWYTLENLSDLLDINWWKASIVFSDSNNTHGFNSYWSWSWRDQQTIYIYNWLQHASGGSINMNKLKRKNLDFNTYINIEKVSNMKYNVVPHIVYKTWGIAMHTRITCDAEQLLQLLLICSWDKLPIQTCIQKYSDGYM